jgi:hypothetical protein
MAVNGVFTSNDWGKTEGVAVSDGLYLGGCVYIPEGEGPAFDYRDIVGDPRGFNSSLRKHIVGREGAFVNQIALGKKTRNSVTFHPYVVAASGRGPKGAFSGSLVLHFTDRTGDTYELMIWSSNPGFGHAVGFSSSDPVITKIRWFHSVI